MYQINFYEDSHGRVPLTDYLDDLKFRSIHEKHARIQRQKILSYLCVLKQDGVGIGEPYVKYLEDGIWELRPLDNRLLFFICRGERIVILHFFKKRTARTPRREIEQAKRNRSEWLRRKDN